MPAPIVAVSRDITKGTSSPSPVIFQARALSPLAGFPLQRGTSHSLLIREFLPAECKAHMLSANRFNWSCRSTSTIGLMRFLLSDLCLSLHSCVSDRRGDADRHQVDDETQKLVAND